MKCERTAAYYSARSVLIHDYYLIFRSQSSTLQSIQKENTTATAAAVVVVVAVNRVNSAILVIHQLSLLYETVMYSM